MGSLSYGPRGNLSGLPSFIIRHNMSLYQGFLELERDFLAGFVRFVRSFLEGNNINI